MGKIAAWLGAYDFDIDNCCKSSCENLKHEDVGAISLQRKRQKLSSNNETAAKFEIDTRESMTALSVLNTCTDNTDENSITDLSLSRPVELLGDVKINLNTLNQKD